MTVNERRLLLALEAVAVAASLAISAFSVSLDSRELDAAERAIAAAPRPDTPSDFEIRAASTQHTLAVPEPEAAAEALREAGFEAGLAIDRYAIVRKDGAEGVELAVSGSVPSMAGFLDATRTATPGYRVERLSIRKVENRAAGTRLEASLTLYRSDAATLPASIGSPESFALLMGLAIPKARVLPAPAPLPAAPAAEALPPPRRLAYVGSIATESGSEHFIKDLDSGRVVRLGDSYSSADAWRLAGRDGDILLLEIEGRSYRISTK